MVLAGAVMVTLPGTGVVVLAGAVVVAVGAVVVVVFVGAVVVVVVLAGVVVVVVVFAGAVVVELAGRLSQPDRMVAQISRAGAAKASLKDMGLLLNR